MNSVSASPVRSVIPELTANRDPSEPVTYSRQVCTTPFFTENPRKSIIFKPGMIVAGCSYWNVGIFQLFFKVTDMSENTENRPQKQSPAGGLGYGRRHTHRSGKGLTDRPRKGPSEYCVCPRCKKSIAHQRGMPCNLRTCPSCGTQMTRG